MFRGFGFVQFERIEEAEAAKAAQKGRIYKGYKIGKAQLRCGCSLRNKNENYDCVIILSLETMYWIWKIKKYIEIVFCWLKVVFVCKASYSLSIFM